MNLKKLITICSLAVLGSLLVSQPTYSLTQRETQQLIKMKLNNEDFINKSEPWLIPLIEDKKIYYGSDLPGKPKMTPDNQVHTFFTTIRGFEEEDNKIFIYCANDALKMDAVELIVGDTGNKNLDRDLIEFIRENSQAGNEIYVVGIYAQNTNMRYGSREFQAPALNVLYARTAGKPFVPKTYKEAKQDTPVSIEEEPKPTQKAETPQATETNDPTSTSELIEQEGQNLEKANQKINEVYKKLMAAIKAPQVKKDLRNQQRQWIKDRDKYCAPPKTNHELGTIWQLSEVSCHLYWTNYRADQLEEILFDYE